MAHMILIILLVCSYLSGFFFLWHLPVVKREKEKVFQGTVSIIIPARNEEKNLPDLLSSLHAQSLPIKEIIIVDDESDDNTVSVSKAFGAFVLSTKKAGSRRKGKASACWLGAQRATGDYLIFMDADTHCAQDDAINDILTHYQKRGDTGLFSIQPFHVIRSIYETLSIVPNIVVLSGLNRYTFLDRFIQKRGAFGPFLLVKAAEYYALGGHEATLYTHMDGIAMADLYQKENLPVNVYGGKGVVHFRMYPEGLKQLIQGWTKSFTYGAKVTQPLVMAAIILWIMGTFLIVAGLIDSLLRMDISLLTQVIAAYLLHSLQFRWLMNKVGNFPFWTMFLSLFYVGAFLGLYLWAVIQVYVMRRVMWRGREYKS